MARPGPAGTSDWLQGLRAWGAPIDPVWLEEELTELDQMVARGETLDVVSKLAALMREPRRVGSAVLEDTLH